MTSPFRTGSTVRWGIEVFCDLDEMAKVREVCADLIEGIDQSKEDQGPWYGEDGTEHTTLFVEPASVGEAVRRINELGHSTDEDEDEPDELIEGVDYPVDSE